MRIKPTADIKGLHLLMRPVLRTAEEIWIESGRPEGITITSGLDGVHSAASWHPYGLAVDLRTNYWPLDEAEKVYKLLKKALSDYDVIHHVKEGPNGKETSHIHVEPSNPLAETHGLLI